MNKKVLLVTLLVVLVAGAFLYTLFNKPAINQAKQEMTSTGQPAQDTPQPPPAASTPTAGAYVAYSPDIIAKTSGTKLLFFHAPWCPQCRMLDADITAHGVPEGITIIKVDYDSNQELRQKYGVTIQTTIVRVDDAGNALNKFVAYDSPTLAAVLKGAF